MDRPLIWLHGEVRTPPFSPAGRLEAGYLLRQLQHGAPLRLPHLRPMPATGPRCHELRIHDENISWRIVVRVDPDAIVILDVFRKHSRTTPHHVIERCRRRLRAYETARGKEDDP